MTIHVQYALRRGEETLESLTEKYGIVIKRHKDYPELVMFKYSQIDSPMGEPLVQQCRGLILCESEGWRTVARPFDKFFNIGEKHAPLIDWPSATAFEKADGSLIIMYAYRGKWHVATSGTPDASGPVNGADLSFADLFWQVWKEKQYRLPINSSLTFMFELMTPLNKIVVQYPKSNIKLIGIRDRDNGQERPIDFYQYYEPAKRFYFNSLKDITDSFDTMKATEQEGYVVVDGFFNRVKVKHPEYVVLHRLRDNFTPRGVLDLIRRGEGNEVAVYFPEWRDIIEKVTESYEKLATEIHSVYLLNSGIESQKEFALTVHAAPYASVLFGLRNGKVASVKEGLLNMDIDKLGDLVGIGRAIASGLGIQHAMPNPELKLLGTGTESIYD